MAAAQNTYISIDKIAELKGLKSNRTLRIAINNEKYIARKFRLFNKSLNALIFG